MTAESKFYIYLFSRGGKEFPFPLDFADYAALVEYQDCKIFKMFQCCSILCPRGGEGISFPLEIVDYLAMAYYHEQIIYMILFLCISVDFL